MTYTIIEDLFDENDTRVDNNHNMRKYTNNVVEKEVMKNEAPSKVSPPVIEVPREKFSVTNANQNDYMKVNDINHELSCKDVFNHVENCPMCSSYFKKDSKFYIIIILILGMIILYLLNSKRRK